MADLGPARCADGAAVVVRAAVPAGRRSTSSTRPAACWCPSRCSCRAAQQFASTLVNGLLQGPSPELAAPSSTFLPSRPAPGGLGAGVGRRRGSGRSDQRRGRGALAPPEPERLVAQLAWTLRQDPGIAPLRRDHRRSRGDAAQRRDASSASGTAAHYAPYVADASPMLYGLRDGRLVAGSAAEPRRGERSVRARRTTGLRSVAPGHARRPGGRRLRGRHARCGSARSTTRRARRRRRSSDDGADLLDPAWDFQGPAVGGGPPPGGAVVQYPRGTELHTLDDRRHQRRRT